MQFQINQSASVILKFVGIICFQTILSLLFYGCHSKYIKKGYSFWFSILAPSIICFLLYRFIAKPKSRNQYLVETIIILLTIGIEAMALYACVLFFGE